MILTKKGSTRANLHALFAATLILVVTRVIVTAFEGTLPDSSYNGIAWNKVPDIIDKDTIFDTEKSDPKKPKIKKISMSALFKGNTDNRPILIFFTDASSPMCKSMEHLSLFNPAVKRVIENDYYPVKISLNEPLTRAEYQVYSKIAAPGVPALTIATPSGETITYKTGYFGAVRAYILLRQTANKIYEQEVAKTKATKEEKDPEKDKDSEKVKEPEKDREPGKDKAGKSQGSGTKNQ